jgi:hypothetical protein
MGFSFRDDLPKCQLVENARRVGDSSVARGVPAFKKLSVTTQPITAHILDDYLLPRWGGSFALDIEPDQIEEWLDAQELDNPTKEKIRRVMNVVYRRGQTSGLLRRTGDRAFGSQPKDLECEAE